MTADDTLFQRLDRLNEIGASLSSERNIQRLLENILDAAQTITRADGGTLYLVTDDARHLRFEAMRTKSLGWARGGTTGQAVPYGALPLYTEAGEPNNAMVAACAAVHRSTVNIADAYEAPGFDFTGTRAFDARTGYRSRSFLTVPMKSHDGEVIGVLQLINCVDPQTGSVVPFSDADQRLAESLASQASVALTNRRLVVQLEALFESFITLINRAIDDKSPYTGRHCHRVPELTMMLAEAAEATREGPLAGFHMTEDDRHELRIAALLHDCGKVTTPVHVVDKATKLQTLFDRIHLIDTRFEVLKRDAEIALLREQLAAREEGDRPREARAEALYRAALSQLDADRECLRRANQGTERMAEEDRRRVQAIAERYRWRNPAGEESLFLDADEVENLSIPYGTLTEAERQTINHHIVATIRMLESLPWPRHLARVPEFAGGHHERMDGKGYPRGLTREQMSIQARIMGIADIFEALTARDRPYKPGKTLTEALRILGKFRLNGHIDPDLFDVFVRERVYLRYAMAFLPAEQVDDVDDGKIPGYQE